MTLNINHDSPKHGPWDERRALIAEAIRKRNPDVVALQAVRRRKGPNGIDQLAELKDSLPAFRYDWFFPMAIDAGGDIGLAFLSRVPFQAPAALPLERIDQDEDAQTRAAVRIDIDTQSGRLSILNAHVSWVPAQARRNIDQLTAWTDAKAGRKILVGDFNAAPDAPVLAPLRDAGWNDVWSARRDGGDGFTFESVDPTQRIDYVWAGPGAIENVTQIDVVDERRPDVRMSDHLGLMAELNV